MKRPELLAPAGSEDALKAALANGADAIYLGGQRFNARQSAANFSDSQLERSIQLAHRAGAKIYVTVNTLLKDEEIEEAAHFLRFLYNVGADAAIVQDPGLIAVAKATTPQLELHASTQVTIHNAQGVNALAALGIERVVLARELSIKQIEQVAQDAKVGLEVFVHGALCIAYSGQCLFSSLTGGRSGNRGQCAQPCRLPYRLNDSTLGNLLSPKDLCLYEHIERLMRAGVASWKIEGRLKRPSYVGTVVRYYREAIDRVLAGEHATDKQAQFEMAQAFNRGFTTGYAFGRPGTDLLTEGVPGHRGVTVGTGMANGDVLLEQDILQGDLFVDPHGREILLEQCYLGNKLINHAKAGGRIRIPGLTLTQGQQLIRLRSQAQEQAMNKQVNDYQPPGVPLKYRVWLNSKQPLVVVAEAGGCVVRVQGQELPEAARKSPIDFSLLERQLGKLGNTGFCFDGLTATIEDGLAVPVSEINHCRRLAVEELTEKLWGVGAQLPAEVNLPVARCLSSGRKGGRLAAAVMGVAELEIALRHGIERIYLGTSYHSKNKASELLADIVRASDLCKEYGSELYLRLPRILLPDELVEWRDALQAAPPLGLLASNWGGVSLARELQVPYVLDTSMNAFNCHFEAAVPDSEGFLLSTELTKTESNRIVRLQSDHAHLLIHARHLLMIHEQCIIGLNQVCQGQGCSGNPKYLHDRKGYRFPVIGDKKCRSYIYNSQAFSLIDEISSLVRREFQPRFFMLDLETESRDTLERLLPLYQAALVAKRQPAELRQQLEQLYPEGLTRGHWKRGV